jgi:hypothetical protein
MSEQSDARLPLSVLVPVKNEAANLTGCIASVSFALRATPFGTAIERKRWLKRVAASAPFRPSLRFLYHYVWKHGFRDGYRGWALCRLLAWYERMIVLKEREMKQRLRNPTAAAS